MIRFIQYLIFGHIHEWETIDDRPLTDEFGSKGTRVRLKCKHCGEWKCKDLI